MKNREFDIPTVITSDKVENVGWEIEKLKPQTLANGHLWESAEEDDDNRIPYEDIQKKTVTVKGVTFEIDTKLLETESLEEIKRKYCEEIVLQIAIIKDICKKLFKRNFVIQKIFLDGHNKNCGKSQITQILVISKEALHHPFQLANVICHEIAHFLCDETRVHYSNQIISYGGLEISFGNKNNNTRLSFSTFLNEGMTEFVGRKIFEAFKPLYANTKNYGKIVNVYGSNNYGYAKNLEWIDKLTKLQAHKNAKQPWKFKRELRKIEEKIINAYFSGDINSFMETLFADVENKEKLIRAFNQEQGTSDPFAYEFQIRNGKIVLKKKNKIQSASQIFKNAIFGIINFQPVPQ